MSKSYAYTHRQTYKDIKTCDQVNLSDSFSLGPPPCFIYFQTHIEIDVQAETDNVGENDGNYCGADL